MRKSKKIKELEARVDALSIMTETLLGIVYQIMHTNSNKPDIESGKWYKETP